jgi:uncharacterized protein
MLFDLLVDNDGKQETWTFGSNSCAVTNAKGERLNPKGPGWQAPDDEPDRSLVKPYALEILLGYKCNMQCTYCYQKRSRDLVAAHATPDKVEPFMEKIRRLNPDGYQRLDIWGGEPLVYLKTLKKLLPALRRNYPEAELGMVTNGLLLSYEIIDWLAELNVSIGVSCDPTDNKRALSVLELCAPQLAHAAKKLKRFHLQMTVTPGAEDVKAAYDVVVKRLGMPVRFSCANVLRNMDGGMREEDVLIDREKYESSLFELCTGPYKKYIGLSTVRHWEHSIRSREPRNMSAYSCGVAAGNCLSIDLDGRIYDCHAKGGVIGDVSDPTAVKPAGIYRMRERSGCDKCPWAAVCRSSCSVVTQEGFPSSCANYKARYGAAFIVAMHRLYGVRVLKISTHKELFKWLRSTSTRFWLTLRSSTRAAIQKLRTTS